MTHTPTDGCQDGEIRASYIIKTTQRERINDVAWWERKDIKDIAQEAFDFYLANKKDVPERPKKKVA